MAIVATIPSGVTSVTVHGAHQWDYGQELEVRAPWFPDEVEMHFACQGMKEAAVRSCTAESGVFLAHIPDVCLEQSTPINAWVYEKGTNSGRTLARVVIQVEARVRPAVSKITN